jgi:hypothetical protein
MNNQAFARITAADPMTTRYNPRLRFQVRVEGGFNGVSFETRADAAELVEALRVCECGMIVRDGAPHFATAGHVAAGTVGVAK